MTYAYAAKERESHKALSTVQVSKVKRLQDPG